MAPNICFCGVADPMVKPGSDPLLPTSVLRYNMYHTVRDFMLWLLSSPHYSLHLVRVQHIHILPICPEHAIIICLDDGGLALAIVSGHPHHWRRWGDDHDILRTCIEDVHWQALYTDKNGIFIPDKIIIIIFIQEWGWNLSRLILLNLMILFLYSTTN